MDGVAQARALWRETAERDARALASGMATEPAFSGSADCVRSASEEWSELKRSFAALFSS